ncbi:MAG: type II secretion system F family protein [Granulosicoccus sp.]|nr:type II secretion system F family protein [Granulosicoccus sp.]
MNQLVLLIILISLVCLSYCLLSFISARWQAHWNYLISTLDMHLRQANRYEKTRHLIIAYHIIFSLFALLVYLSGATIALVPLFIVLMLLLPGWFFKYLHIRRIRKINQALPDSLSQIAASMRAGSTFQIALQSLVDHTNGALEQEFETVLKECRVGVRMEDALVNMTQRTDSEEIELVVSAVTIAQELGGNLSDVLQGLSDTLRRKIEMEGKIQTLTAQGRLQGKLVSALPLFILLVLSVLEPAITMPIFGGLLGWLVLAIMFLLSIAAGLSVRKIVRIDI